MTCIVEFPSKKAFKEAVADEPVHVHVYDPSIFNERRFNLTDMAIGETIYVTNHPKRSWFAQVRRTGSEAWKVS